MTYGVTDRQQAAMIVAIREFYRYFDTCPDVSAHASIQVRIRYRVYYYNPTIGYRMNGHMQVHDNATTPPCVNA